MKFLPTGDRYGGDPKRVPGVSANELRDAIDEFSVTISSTFLSLSSAPTEEVLKATLTITSAICR